MIRTEELMLGNWVFVDGVPRQVEAITKRKIAYHKDEQKDKGLYYAPVDELDPIRVNTAYVTGVSPHPDDILYRDFFKGLVGPLHAIQNRYKIFSERDAQVDIKKVIWEVTSYAEPVKIELL